MTYRYRIQSTGFSSARYGACEVCQEHCSEVFHQVEEQALVLDEQGGKTTWTRYDCRDLFGHESCLKGARR